MMLYYQGREVSWLAGLAYPSSATVAYPGSVGYATRRVRYSAIALYRRKVHHTPSTDYSVNGDEAVAADPSATYARWLAS